MEFHDRLSFTIPVLVIAGILLCAWGYYAGGVSKLKETAVVWFAASVIAILFGRWLRRSGHVKTTSDTRWGINPVGQIQCPRCGKIHGQFRIPRSFRQAMWGGWTCSHCGLEVDKWNRPVSE